MRHLILHPVNGLANRLRVIAGGLGLVKDSGEMSLDIVWGPCRFFPDIDYTSLFEPVEKTSNGFIRFAKCSNIVTPRGDQRFFTWKDQAQLLPEEPNVACSAFPEINISGAFACATSGKTAYLKTCHRIYKGDWSRIRPVKRIRREIRKVSRSFGPNTIGVHVRRGDNLKSIQRSPLYEFSRLMKDAADADERTNFFLSTDCQEAADFLRHEFGNRLITRTPDLSRDTLVGTQEAIIDLWLLSRTSRIIGSYWSSFSETAAAISGIQFCCCQVDVIP